MILSNKKLVWYLNHTDTHAHIYKIYNSNDICDSQHEILRGTKAITFYLPKLDYSQSSLAEAKPT